MSAPTRGDSVLHDAGLIVRAPGADHSIALTVQDDDGAHVILGVSRSRVLAPLDTRLDPEQAEHLAQLLMTHAMAARMRGLRLRLAEIFRPFGVGIDA